MIYIFGKKPVCSYVTSALQQAVCLFMIQIYSACSCPISRVFFFCSNDYFVQLGDFVIKEDIFTSPLCVYIAAYIQP